MSETPLAPGSTYLFKHCSRYVKGTVRSLKYRLDPQDLHRKEADLFRLNEIGKAHISFVQPVFADEYTDNRNTGSFVIVDPVTNLTLGAGMITRCFEGIKTSISKQVTHKLKANIYCFDNRKGELSAEKQAKELKSQSIPFIQLSWDDLEQGLNSDLNSRNTEEKLRRIKSLCGLFKHTEVSLILSIPFQPDRLLKSNTKR